MSLLNQFHRFLIRSGCIPSGSRVLVAVSGGADSVALLSLLHQVAEALELHLEAAHLDHALRGTSCDDARFVEELCDDLGVPLLVERREVAIIARQRKGNLEEVARDIRREFLETTARSRNCQLVALGHHADDQAETFLMRLLRGSGPTGLAGMRVVSKTMVRPLLSFRHDDILAYLQSEGIAWREDESNLDQAFTRNRIRHNLLPLLESYNLNIRGQLAGLCERMRMDDDFLVALATKELARCGKWQGNGYTLERSLLLELAPALMGRLVRVALQQVRGDLRGMTATHIADVLKLLESGSPQGELSLPGVWIARRYERLLLYKQKPEADEFFEIVLNGPGDYLLPSGQVLHLLLEKQSLGESAEAVEFAVADLSFPVQLRHCQPGDRIRPSGMSGTKKLQDLFVDLKLTREERQKTLVLLKGDEVLWVVGLRRSEGRRPRDGESVLRFIVKP